MCIAIRSVDMNKMEKVLLAAPFRKLTRLTHVVIVVNFFVPILWQSLASYIMNTL